MKAKSQNIYIYLKETRRILEEPLGAYFSVEKALFMSGGGAFPTSNIISSGGLLRQHQSGMRPVWL